MITKRALIHYALRKLGTASDAVLVDAEPESEKTAMLDAESLAAEWKLNGIDINYQFHTSNEPINPNDDSGLLPEHFNAFADELALRIAPDYQIEPSLPLREAARKSYKALIYSLTKINPLKEKRTFCSGMNPKNGDKFCNE